MYLVTLKLCIFHFQCIQKLITLEYIYTEHVIHFLGCQPGSVRLVGGSSPQEGRIELCAQSSPGVTVWGSVCNAQYYGVAEVVCRQLNYSRSGMNMAKTILYVFQL